VEDAEELALTLTTLGEQLSSSCEFELGAEPEHPALIRVVLDDETLELDAPDGFAWPGPSAIEIEGEACRAWKQGDVSRVRVLEQCTGKAR
jgi:hypothetical protein